MRVLLKHEAMCAGNVSVTDVYDCSEEELRAMVERDRVLRAIHTGCSPCDIGSRNPRRYFRNCGMLRNVPLILFIGQIVPVELPTPMRNWLI